MKNQRLELTWLNKDKTYHPEPRLLIEDTNLSYGDADTENMLIHGDNLLALKALEQDYAGKVKCIYIDPPFNTGAAFEHYDDGVEHSIWLNLMRIRLEILHRLLSDDGVIFVHIDDKEMDYLKIVMDEIFRRENFLNRITIKTSDPSGHKTVNPSPYSQTEYVLMYSKNRRKYIYEQMYVASEYDTGYSKIIPNVDQPYSEWVAFGLNQYYAEKLGFKNTRKAKKAIGALEFDAQVARFALKNNEKVFQATAISSKAGRDTVELRDKSKANPDVVYLQERDDYDDIYILNGRQIYFYSSKVREIEGSITPAKPLTNLWTDIPYNGIASEGGVKFKNGKKPEKLIRRVIELTTNPNDLVLDSFLGSGTTAAVAHKMGRRYIGVELGDHARTHCQPRLRRVVDGEQGGISQAVNWQGGGGFKFYTLAPSLLKRDDHGFYVIDESYHPDQLAAAMAKHQNFTYQPDADVYWKQGYSTENHFIFTTTQPVTVELVDRIGRQLGAEESVLICCKSHDEAARTRHPRVEVEKIPNVLLGRCTFGRDDYSLNIIDLPNERPEPEPLLQVTTEKKPTEEKTTTNQGQQSLFE